MAQILINLFNIILFFFISNVFTNNELSVFLYVTAVCRIFSFLFDCGFNQLILSEFKESKFRKSLIKIFLLRNILSVFIILLIYNIFNYLNILNSLELYTFIFLIIFYLNNENLNYFFSILMNLNKNIFILYSRIIFLLCCFLIFFLDLSFIQVIIYLSITNFIPLIFIFIISNNFLKKEHSIFKNLTVKEIFGVFIFYSSFLILAKGIGEINSNVDMIFVKNITNEFYTSLYGLVIKINQISLIPHMLLGSMILPYFAGLKNNTTFQENFYELRFIHIFCIYFFSILIVPIIIFSQKYLLQFNFELVNFQIILILNILICFFISLHFHIQQILIIKRKYYELFVISLISLTTNILLNIYLIKIINIYGAMISSISSHLIIYCLYIVINGDVKKFLLDDLKKYSIFFLLIILNLIFSFFSYNLFIIFFSISNFLVLLLLIYKFFKKPLYN